MSTTASAGTTSILIPGPKGDLGPTGPQGPQGNVGATGPTGSQGPAGGGATNMPSLVDTMIMTPSFGDSLMWNGTKWMNMAANQLHGHIEPASGTTFLPNVTTPVITDGTEVWTGVFTLTHADSHVQIMANVQMGTDERGVCGYALALFRDNILIGGAAGSSHGHGAEHQNVPLTVLIEDHPADALPHTYSIRVGSYTGTDGDFWVCGQSTFSPWGAAFENASSIFIREIY